jgi:diketogulonate reductase-like aldo/keto reductase
MWTADGRAPTPERRTLEYCAAHGILFEAYSPLGVGGVLLGLGRINVLYHRSSTLSQIH